ncbi:hypothetical protein OIU85_014197 [Salix viminalis]|uniref:Uncharacterized protein n=1 Tax=Salix viminalis TaxID=40686 RepID=A0A9Q0NNE1_SALVM|nr:hypothetical protein OIU85_014197 [Salix viminalis]
MLPLSSLPVATRRLSLLPTYRFTNPSSHHDDFHADLPPGIFAAAVSVAADFQSSRVLIRLREGVQGVEKKGYIPYSNGINEII